MNDSIHKQYSNEVKGLKFDIFERRYSKVFQNLYLAGSQSASWELQAAWQQTGWGGLPCDPWCDQWDPRGNTRWCRGAAAAGHSLHALLLPAESGDYENPVRWLWQPSQVTMRTLSGDHKDPVRWLREPCQVTIRTLFRWPFECDKVNPGLSIFGFPETLLRLWNRMYSPSDYIDYWLHFVHYWF